ncbi:tetratricopeptide repeat-containing sensor histidine kinase [Parabacteroides timonensis]|uniref:tetratricopeptide repeat-containing sensor histidine kinase n=1 Tax=Parabacteroides timonensis TaxID=1871013 RepID=UPI00094E841E|nr:histidine kinase [Parabacteroides timonensis]
MEKQQLTPYGIFVILFSLLLGCSFQRSSVKDAETSKVDSLLSLYMDSLAVKPLEVIFKLRVDQKNVSDSINYYNMEQTISRCYYFSNQTDSAFLLNDCILNFIERQPEKDNRTLKLSADAYNSRGVFFQDMNQWDSAIVCLCNASEALQQANVKDRLPAVNVYINLADCYQRQGHYEWAGFYYRKALFLSDSLSVGDKMNYPIYSGLGRLYQELENYPLSDSYFQKAEQYWSKGTDYEKYYFTNSRGNYYYVTKEYDKALIWFQRANAIVANFPQPIYRGIVEGNIGEIYLLKEQPDSARHYLERSVAFFGQSGLQQPGIKFYMDGLFASLALLENDLQEASRRLEQSYDTLHTDLQYQYYHNKRLEELYRKKNDLAQAYYYRNQADVCGDSLRNMKIENSIRETDFRYRQDTTLLKKDIRIANTEAKALQWMWFAWIAGLGLIIVVLLMVCILFYIRRKKELRYKQQVATITQLRMAVVRNRIAPHYIFNVLNSVMPIFRRYEELSEPVNLLIDVLRGDLLSSEQLAVPLENEIIYVKNYLKLKMLGDPECIHIEWNVSSDVPLETLIPSMSIQIPVENAVKYAFNADSLDPTIVISIYVEDEELHISIDDNGIGYNPGAHARDERSTGQGLKILYRTTDLLNTYNICKMQFSIKNLYSISGKQHGTNVSLIVPLNYNFAL